MLARLRCNLWFYLGVFADRVLVRPIPDAVWHLQRPGCWLYQKCMARSYGISEMHGLGLWKETTESETDKGTV